MTWEGFSPDLPVIVCGVVDGEITENGSGGQRFANLEDARKVFPDLDPAQNTKRFTWAAKGGDNLVRFETWKANEIYSS